MLASGIKNVEKTFAKIYNICVLSAPAYLARQMSVKTTEKCERPALDEINTKPVSHVIFDMNGTILDSQNYILESHSLYLGRYKKAFTAKLRNDVMGMTNLDAGRHLRRKLRLPMTPETYAHGVWQYQRGLLAQCKLVMGIQRLLCHLKEHNVPMAVVTSGNPRSYRIKTRKYDKLFNEVFCFKTLGSDPSVKQGKPYPNLFKVTAVKFPLFPKDFKQFLVVTDSKNGVLAAKHAGMQVLLYPNRSTPDEYRKKADVVTFNFNTWDPADFKLPTYQIYK